jgi:hypothetical protein
MKKLALGIATAAVLLTAAPAMAQVGFFAGPRGVGIGVGVGPGPGPCYYNAYGCNGYYDYAPGPVVGIYGHPGWRHYHHWHR